MLGAALSVCLGLVPLEITRTENAVRGGAASKSELVLINHSGVAARHQVTCAPSGCRFSFTWKEGQCKKKKEVPAVIVKFSYDKGASVSARRGSATISAGHARQALSPPNQAPCTANDEEFVTNASLVVVSSWWTHNGVCIQRILPPQDTSCSGLSNARPASAPKPDGVARTYWNQTPSSNSTRPPFRSRAK